MKRVGNQADLQPGRLENTPKNIIVPVQFARAAITEMGEADRAGFDGLEESFVRRIRMAKADFDAKRCCERNSGDGFEAFRREGEQHKIVASELAEFMNVIGHGIDHERGVVRSRETRLVRKKWAFD